MGGKNQQSISTQNPTDTQNDTQNIVCSSCKSAACLFQTSVIQRQSLFPEYDQAFHDMPSEPTQRQGPLKIPTFIKVTTKPRDQSQVA
jgi:hypothetical protein